MRQQDLEECEARSRQLRDLAMKDITSFDCVLSAEAVAGLNGHDGVYIVSMLGTNAVKVGFSNTLMKRLGQIQTGNPLPCYPAVFLKTKSARSLEGRIHKLAKPGKLIGEWFAGDHVEEALKHPSIIAFCRQNNVEVFIGDAKRYSYIRRLDKRPRQVRAEYDWAGALRRIEAFRQERLEQERLNAESI